MKAIFTKEDVLPLLEDYFQSIPPDQIIKDLEEVMSVYVQDAPVTRIDLANKASSISKLMVLLTRIGAACEQESTSTLLPTDF